MHKVEAGETLAMIGKRYGAAPSVIAAANHLDPESPKTGDYVQIPQAAPSPVRKPVAYRATPRSAASSKAKTAGHTVSGARPKAAVSAGHAASTTAKPKQHAGAVAKASHKQQSQSPRS